MILRYNYGYDSRIKFFPVCSLLSTFYVHVCVFYVHIYSGAHMCAGRCWCVHKWLARGQPQMSFSGKLFTSFETGSVIVQSSLIYLDWWTNKPQGCLCGRLPVLELQAGAAVSGILIFICVCVCTHALGPSETSRVGRILWNWGHKQF